jgi:hypothetical protein
MASLSVLDPAPTQNAICVVVSVCSFVLSLRLAPRQAPAELVLANKHIWRCPMIRKSILVVIGVVLVSLSISNKATARDLRLPSEVSNRVILMDRHDLMRVATRYGLTIRRLKLSTEEKERLAKLASKGCGCAPTPQEASGFSSCFSGCLQWFGVSPMTAVACAAACTANPLGCAICAGIQEWIVLYCAQKCVWTRGGSGGIGDVLGKLKSVPGRRPRTQTAKVKLAVTGA